LQKKTKPRLRLCFNVAMVDSMMELLAGKGPSSSGGRWEYNVLAILVAVIPVGRFRIRKEERSRSDAAERLSKSGADQWPVGRTTPCWKNSGPLAVEPSAVRTDMSILMIRGGLNKYQSPYDYTTFCFAKQGMADTRRSNGLSIYMGSCGKVVYGEGGAIENRPRVDGRWKGGV